MIRKTRRAERYGCCILRSVMSRLKEPMPVLSAQRPSIFAWRPSHATKSASAPLRRYACLVRMALLRRRRVGTPSGLDAGLLVRGDDESVHVQRFAFSPLPRPELACAVGASSKSWCVAGR